MSIRYSLDNNAERRLNWMIKWLEIVKENMFDFYFESIGNSRKFLVVSVHSIGLNFPIALIINGKLITEENIEPSQEAFDAFFTAAMCDVETISISNDDKTIDAFYTTSCLIYKRLKNYEEGECMM